MSDNNLIPFNKRLPQESKKQLPKTIIQVSYQQIDSTHYGFYFDLDDEISGSMEESNSDFHESEHYDTRFESSIEQSERIFYISAAASGLLTGLMDSMGVTDALLKECSSAAAESNRLRSIVISAASLCGYKKKDYQGALKFLYERAERHLKHSLATELHHTPNVTGLIFSIAGQYTKELYNISPNGVLTSKKMPDYYAIGRNDTEKIVYGFLYWIFHVAIEYARRKNPELFEGIPKDIKRIIECLGNLQMLRDIPRTDKNIEQIFSEFLQKIFEDTNILNRHGHEAPYDKFANTVHVNKLKAQVASVIFNECLTRGLYATIAFYKLVKRENPKSINDLPSLDLSEIRPFDNRIVSRMCLVSSGVFAFVNVVGAVSKALRGKMVGGRPFTASFIANLNLPGIGRFAFAIAQDLSYLGEDIQVLFSRAVHADANDNSADEELDYAEASKVFRALQLDPYQSRILCSLENAAIRMDVEQTQDIDGVHKKDNWFKAWQYEVIKACGASDESYFMDENEIYRVLFELDQSGKKESWVYLIALELSLFEPYSIALGGIDPKKLKRTYDYALERYALKQTLMSKDDIVAMRKHFSKYGGIVDGSSFRRAVSLTAVAGTVILTGGTALAFAPTIAVALAGGAFPGLYGAALTNASLAFFGGGSLAAGGFGMAGGSAVIAGGGALLGMGGSGAVANIAVARGIMNSLEVSQLAKLLTYSKVIFLDKLSDRQSVKTIHAMLNALSKSLDKQIEDVRSEKNDLNKELLEELERFKKCVRNAEKALDKIA